MEAFLRDHPDIRMVWTPDSQTRVNVSRYNSAAVSQLVINLRPARLLTASASAGDQEAQSLQRQVDELRQVRPHPWSSVASCRGQPGRSDAMQPAWLAQTR